MKSNSNFFLIKQKQRPGIPQPCDGVEAASDESTSTQPLDVKHGGTVLQSRLRPTLFHTSESTNIVLSNFPFSPNHNIVMKTSATCYLPLQLNHSLCFCLVGDSLLDFLGRKQRFFFKNIVLVQIDFWQKTNRSRWCYSAVTTLHQTITARLQQWLHWLKSLIVVK